MRALFLISLLVNLLFISSPVLAKDLRAVKIERFISSYCPESPLIEMSEDIVAAADRFGLDYRLYVAISGVESGFGKKYIKRNQNLTGICNGSTRFKSIHDNIYKTYRLIAEGKWYKKFRRTNKIEDLVYTFKGVPPYTRYIQNIKFIYHKIESVPVDDELYAKEKLKENPEEKLQVWQSLLYNACADRQEYTFGDLAKN